MSLLEKALGETPSTGGRSGLFAKAAAAQAQLVAQRPGPDELLKPVNASPIVVPRFEFSIDEIAALETELLDLPDSADYFLAVFERVSEALPLKAIALFLPELDGLAAAASLGFPAASTDYVPESLAMRSGRPGSLLPPEDAALLSSLLGVPSALPLHGAAMTGGAGEILGQWIFADDDLDRADETTITALGRLLAAPGRRGVQALAIATPSPDPAAELLSAGPGESWAAAFRLDLAPSYLEFDLRVPGILSSSFRSVFVSAAVHVLGRRGAAVLTEDGFLACLFFSSTALDPDLALFQFRKSLKRALPLFEGIELPSGKAISLDLASVTAPAELSRFLAE